MLRYFFASAAKQSSFPHLKVTLHTLKSVQQIKPTKLKEEEIHYLFNIHSLQGSWKIEQKLDKISKVIKFKDFIEAFSFMSQAAFVAEELGHHPDWFNVYNEVRINLNTHDIGGLSIKDIIFAHAIDIIVYNIKTKSATSLSDMSSLNISNITSKWNNNFEKK